jgi:IS4 transposase
VTLFGCASVRASYLRNRDEIPVSLVAVYEKLQGVEPAVCEAVVGRTADRGAALVGALQATRPEPIDGYRLRIADGNVLYRTDRRLKILQGTNVAALPGRTVAIFDHATQLISRLVVCENAHTSEKRLMLELLPHIDKNDLFMADCGFGTMEFFRGLRERQAGFLIRRHSSMKLTPLGKRRRAGRCRTGEVFEQRVQSSDGQEFRAIIIKRDKPLPNGKRELILLTNLPKSKATAKKLALLYLKRWTIEEAFRQLTQYLSCEISTLGYPKAALLAFSLAVLAYNCLGCVKAALAGRFGWEKVDVELSSYYLALEVKRTYEGMCIAVPEKEWLPYATMDVQELAAELLRIAKNLDWRRYRKSPRGPKKSFRKTRKQHVHAATATLLEQSTKQQPK